MTRTNGILPCVLLLLPAAAMAHGPQLQITNTGGKIVTREVLVNDYTTLTAEKSAYVAPATLVQDLDFGASWRLTATDDVAYPFGPGLAFGLGATFAADSTLSVSFLDELQVWDGAAFVSAGATELIGMGTSNPNATSLTDNVGVSGTGDPTIERTVNYGHGGDNAHASITWALLGDGADPTSPVADGVYLATLQIASSESSIAPSDPFHLVLNKGPSDELFTAVSSLGLAPSSVQFLVIPEPASFALVAIAFIATARRRS